MGDPLIAYSVNEEQLSLNFAGSIAKSTFYEGPKIFPPFLLSNTLLLLWLSFTLSIFAEVVK
jgi:hypothetical protein